jgi:hypothetical protein
MRWSDRQARIKKAKELGHIAYRLARAKEVYGVIDVEDEEKHLREFEQRGLTVTLLSPFRAAAHEDEFSRLKCPRAFPRPVGMSLADPAATTAAPQIIGSTSRSNHLHSHPT